MARLIPSHAMAATLALLLLATPAAQAQSGGYSTLIHVTDQKKHAAPTESDVTFIHYSFAYSGSAPNPSALLETERVGTAWILLNMDHHYHDGNPFLHGVRDENDIVYKVHFNALLIEYRTHLTVEPISGDGPFGFLIPRGKVMVEYKVYNETGVLVADERDEDTADLTALLNIPDSRIWIQYENGTLAVTPDFTAHGILPRFFDANPPDSPGRVEIHNVTFDSIALEIVAAKSLQHVKLAYGFSKPGIAPRYSFTSLVQDAATSIGGLLGNVLNSVLDFVFKFLPHGDKILVVKEYVVLLYGVVWEVFVQDPILLGRVVLIFAIGYGLLLWIDPMFQWLFKPLWYVPRTAWKVLVWLWELFMKIVSLIGSKITGG